MAHDLTAKYRVTKKDGDSQISFAPVQRVDQLDTGEVTELRDFNINLNDKLRQDLGDMNVGDEKEFSMVVNFLTGYHLAGHPPTGVTG